MRKSESGQFIIPGDKLGVIEEFIPGPGTYVEKGSIHSKTIGRALIDMLTKMASVYSLVRPAGVPKPGCTVIGQVSNSQSRTATLRIFIVGKRVISGFFTGILHISDARSTYVESMSDVCKINDILRAKVLSDKNRVYHLSTEEQNLGVIYAFCSQCGHMLVLQRRRVNCVNCGQTKRRKIALDYGKSEI